MPLEAEDIEVDGESAEPEVTPEAPVEEFEVKPVDREAETPKPKTGNRTTRRADAITAEKTARERAETTARAAQEKADRLEREFSDFRAEQQARQRQAEASQPSPHLATLKSLRSRWETHAAAAVNPRLDEASRRKHIDDAHDLELEMGRVQHKMFREEEAKDAPDDQSEQRAAAQREQQYLEARFPWLEGSAKMNRRVWAEFEGLAEDGRPRNRATMVEACANIAKQFNLGGKDTGGGNGSSRRYGAIPGGEGGGGGDSPRSIRVGEAEKKLARAMFPQAGPEEAVKLWVKEMAPYAKGSE